MKNNKQEKYLRMTLNERIQHLILLVSFFVLVITGFALKYPEAFWVTWLKNLFGENAFELRGIVHRIAGVLLIAVSVYHLFYVILSGRGRKLISDMVFKKSDILELVANVNYLVGIKKEKPRFGRFSYIEKAEYWALVWGTVLMSITGIVLWFENYFITVMSNLGMEISTIIHFYEAILASLAILVWHFYFVIFRPGIFPMNMSWLTGYLSREEMEQEHPRELEELEKTNIPM